MNEKQSRAIEFLEKVNKHSYKWSYQELFIWLKDFVPHVPINSTVTKNIYDYHYDQYVEDKSIIYRARENENDHIIEGESYHKLPFFLVDEISIVPDKHKEKINFGRCNKEKEPRFYASPSHNVASMEAITSGFPNNGRQIQDKQKGGSTHCTIGVWKVIDDLTLAIINHTPNSVEKFLAIDNKLYSNHIANAKKDIEDFIRKLKEQGENEDNIEYYLKLFTIFTEEFNKIDIHSPSDYYLTNFYCDCLLNTNKDSEGRIDGIVFPSISYSLQHTNVMLFPHALKKIKLLSAFNSWLVYFPKQKQMQFIPDNIGHHGKIQGNEIIYPVYYKEDIKQYKQIIN